jgi:K+-sensing histidine kinase KdpD
MHGAPNTDGPASTEPSTAEQELEHALGFLSHDARSGHSSTLALLDLQRIQAEPMSLQNLLARIEANARRSLDTIDDFADLIRARRQPLRCDAFEMTDLLVEVVADAWSGAQQNGVKILIAPGPASLVVRADRALLASALAKLLRDAVGAATQGAEIRCSAGIEGAEAIVAIAETIGGPATADAAAAPRTSRKVPTSVLFARAVIERHSGRLSQSADTLERRTRLSLPMRDVFDSILP